MRFWKGVLVAFAVLMVGVSTLYAHSNADLKTGVYRETGVQGGPYLVIRPSREGKTFTIYAPNGRMFTYGTGIINGTLVSVAYKNDVSETYTIVDEETFTTETGATFKWFRNARVSEL